SRFVDLGEREFYVATEYMIRVKEVEDFQKVLYFLYTLERVYGNRDLPLHRSASLEQFKLCQVGECCSFLRFISSGYFHQWSSIFADRSDTGFLVRVDQERIVKRVPTSSHRVLLLQSRAMKLCAELLSRPDSVEKTSSHPQNKEVHPELLKCSAKVEKHSISLEIALQKRKEHVKNDTVWNKKASNVFRKEREQYIKIQYLKAQLQDKNIAISELKKLIAKGKGKSIDTKFDKPSVVRQPNAQRIPKPSVLGKPAPFSNSFERIYFTKTMSVPKTNVPEGLPKPVIAQTLPQTTRQAVCNINALNPKCIESTTGVNHKTNVSKPQHKSNQSRDKVLPNNSQVKLKKTQVEVHPRIPSVSNKMKSITAYALAELQCLYLPKVKGCDCLAQKLSNQTESVSKEVHPELLKRFAKVEKHSISLEIALQKCKEHVKNDTVWNKKASNVFRKESEQYIKIQDLKAQLQDKNIVISKLKKLIEKGKGKSVDTKFINHLLFDNQMLNGFQNHQF
nr:hypothetical protein [Tanacetum cinerariifolium]